MVNGQGDPELHPEGRIQAERIADRLADQGVGAIYVTPLRRTAESAAPLAARLGITPVVEPGFVEVHLGEWEGGEYRTYFRENHPLVTKLLEEERWDVIPGAEPADAFALRVRTALHGVAERHPDQLVAVFTHGAFIGRAMAEVSGSRPFAFNGADNGSISHLVLANGRWVIRGFNDTSHLTNRFSVAPQALT